MEMHIDPLPAGGASGAAETAVSPLTAESSAHERYFIRYNDNPIKTFLKPVSSLQRSLHRRWVWILKHAVLMFIQWSQPPQETLMYTETQNMCLLETS